jgi:hypothetical protein
MTLERTSVDFRFFASEVPTPIYFDPKSPPRGFATTMRSFLGRGVRAARRLVDRPQRGDGGPMHAWQAGNSHTDAEIEFSTLFPCSINGPAGWRWSASRFGSNKNAAAI